ncbi:MAG: NAD(P)-dependent alcohol dehydrogenase [Planctomycetes bacterium]|nr:NAD(P)-dependent alcohol dehydrogenase [Planctomycetota bacterium]
MPEASAPTMRAVVQRAYGPPAILRVESAPRPVPAARDAVVRVCAAPVQQGDWHLLRGLPYLLRLLGFGLRRPRRAVPGQYAAGIVEAVGAEVTDLRAGDRVLGSCAGAWAEHALAPADHWVAIPAQVSFEQAAALPHGGLAALQALRDAGRLAPGQRVLVHGASGAVGALAVQIAKVHGARVTATSRAHRLDEVRGLGADEVRDGTRDGALGTAEHDLLVDTVGDRPLAALRRALAPGGRAVLVSGGTGRWLGGMHRVLLAALGSLPRRTKLAPFVAAPRTADLRELLALCAAGRIVARVDRSFPLAAIGDAFRRLESRDARGTIVVTP